MPNRLLMLCLLLLIAISANADVDLDNLNQLYERVLLPIGPVGAPLPGQNGSSWTVEIVGRNNAAEPVYATPLPPLPGGIYVSYPQPQAAHATFRPGPLFADPGVGEFLFVSAGHGDDVAVSIRVRDLSRQLQTWATAVPVVRQRDVFTRVLTLLDIPSAPEFRVTLRVYDFDEAAGRRVEVRIYREGTDSPVTTRQLDLRKYSNGTDRFFFLPGAASIGNVTDALPDLPAIEKVRIEVVPLTQGLRFWAFASITNNSTQHVTLALPQ